MNCNNSNSVNIVEKIVEKRKSDIEKRGYNFGFEIPKKRIRPVVPFMAERGVILEVKRASPSKGDISPNLEAAKTAQTYRKYGAKAISVLTEENYFKGSLKDLIEIADSFKNVGDTAILRKDFLIDEKEIEIAYLCGADAVLLICGILSEEKLFSMTKKCFELNIRAFIEIRSEKDIQKTKKIRNEFPETVVCGVNSRDLKTFEVDTLIPSFYLPELGKNVIFESGLLSKSACKSAASMGFNGILLGEGAAKNPEKAGEFVKGFVQSEKNSRGDFWIKYSEILKKKNSTCYKPLVKICGITNKEDAILSAKMGADFIGMILSPGFLRTIDEKTAREISNELKNYSEIQKVAVVTNPDSEEGQIAKKLVEEKVLDCIQLHGIDFEEGEKYCSELPHFYAITNDVLKNCENLEIFGEPRFLQDSKNHEYKKSAHMWIAGKINYENVSELINQFKPELIDVSSGIEIEKCKKDENLLKNFMNVINSKK